MSFVEEDEVATFRSSGKFDEQWYVEQYPDVRLAGIDPAMHFLWIGKKLGRHARPRDNGAEATAVKEDARGRPTAEQHGGHPTAEPQGHRSPAQAGNQARRTAGAQIASAQQRRSAQLAAAHRQVRQELKHANVAACELSPDAGRAKARKPTKSRVFDRRFVKSQMPDRPARSVRHYLRDPAYRRVDPHPLFAAAGYLERYPDIAHAGVSPLQHYLEHGWREGRDPHPYFANDWYLEHNPDVRDAGINPLEHYLEHGWKEGRRPNPVFDPTEYLARYPDVRASGMEPLSHYVLYGRAEKRDVPFKGFERDWRSLVPYSSETFLMDHLLFEQVPVAPAEFDLADHEADGSWPPRPLNGYWPPQLLRDFIINSYGEPALATYWYLYSVMDAFVESPEAFASSEACQLIVSRVKTRSAERAAAQTGKPAASIVVPVYNNFLDTLLCIASVLEIDSEASFEIIVADDGSTDATSTIIPMLGGVIRQLRQPRNLGFLGNCNAAAAIAEGEAIVLLNNDTLVLPGWLDGLLAPFDRSELVGLVGSKLINWDGTLQEAGGIYWDDGSAWNFGRNQDPGGPEFNYLKDTDYCSGASIAVPASLWRQLGGFDSIYSPAYCEDADLAFQIRAAGCRTLYNPLSAVIHHEGRSHGRDTGSGIKAYQVRNLERLVDRWRDVLRHDHYPNAQNVLRARDRSRNRRHVLVVDHYVPQWDQDAGSRSVFQYLEIFLDLGFHVTFWPDNLYRDPVYTPVLQSMGVEVIYGAEFIGGFDKFIQARGDLYDAVLLNRPYISIGYLPSLKEHSRARILYYGHDLHYKRMERSRDIGEPEDPVRIAEMRELELRVCRQSDVIFYPDPEEVRIVAEQVGGSRAFIANPVYVYDDVQIEIGRTRIGDLAENTSKRLFFVGGFSHTPNRDGILWFVRKVLPLIAAEIPDVTLAVAGSNPPPDIVALSSEQVAILGRVSDEQLEQLYAEAPLAIAPLRYGAGVKGKVIEAMAQGVPMATTSVGAQGVDSGGEALFIGDSPDEFASAVVLALTDRHEARRRAERALNLVRHRYSRKAMAELFRRLIVENANG